MQQLYFKLNIFLQYLLQEYRSKIKMKSKAKQMSFFVIIFFEFWGTFLFAYLNFQDTDLYHTAQQTTGSLALGTNYFFALFIVLSYGRQFSGGIYNSTITFYRMIRITDRLSLKIGLLYLVVQQAGALLGSFQVIYVWNGNYAPYTIYLPGDQQFKRFLEQFFAGFLLSFMVQFIVDKRFTFIQHNRQAYIALPLIFMITKSYFRNSLMNPTHGFAFQCTYAIKFRTWVPIQMAYIPYFGPYCGAAIACLAFQYVLKPLYPYKRQQIQSLLQKILKENEKKLRVSKIKQSQIQAYRQNYKKQALKMGIQIDSQDQLQKQSLMQSQSQNNGEPIQRQIQNNTIYQTQSVANSNNRSLKRKKPKRRVSKLVNRRWTLGEILTSQPMKAPMKKFQQKFFKLNIQNYKQQKPQIQYMNDDIQSIQDSQQQAPLIITKNKSKASDLESVQSGYKPSLVIKQQQQITYRRLKLDNNSKNKIKQSQMQDRGSKKSASFFNSFIKNDSKIDQFKDNQFLRQNIYEKSISIKQSPQFAPRLPQPQNNLIQQLKQQNKKQANNNNKQFKIEEKIKQNIKDQ